MYSETNFASSQYACGSLFFQASESKKIATLSKYLKENNGTSDQSTVSWIDHTDQKVIFKKNRDGLWLSRHLALEKSLTAEGDLRLPMFLFGAKLSVQLGFGIYEFGKSNSVLEVAIPDADQLARLVSEINASLKARGLEPMTYLPVRTGYISVDDGIQLALSASGDYLMHFPYADEHQILVPHEAAFHLGAMMLPAKIIRRARLITQETINFLKILKSHQAEFGAKAQTLIDQIMLERSFELDAGLASSVTTPAHARRDHGMKTYSEILPLMSEKSWQYLQRAMEYLNRPKLQPFEAVLTRLQIMTGIDLSEFVKGDNSGFMVREIASQGIGNKINLNQTEQKVLRKIVVSYLNSSPRPGLEINNSKQLAEDYIGGLDKRITDVSASFK